jgi:hypothetical protein
MKKYPDMNVGVTIEQNGDRVSLIIDLPEGRKERIEQELTQYGLVISGDLPPDKYLGDPNEVMALKHKLELAALEVRQTRDLLYSERHQYDARITQLESQTQMLRDFFDKEKYATAELISSLKDLTQFATSSSNDSLQAIVRILEERMVQERKAEIIEQLQNIQRNDQSFFEKLGALIVKGAIQGAAGNYLYAFLQAVSKMG